MRTSLVFLLLVLGCATPPRPTASRAGEAWRGPPSSPADEQGAVPALRDAPAEPTERRRDPGVWHRPHATPGPSTPDSLDEPPGPSRIWTTPRPRSRPAAGAWLDAFPGSDATDAEAGDGDLRDGDLRTGVLRDGDPRIRAEADRALRADDALDAEAARVPAPPVGDVLAAAYAAAGLDDDPTVGWSRRARLAGLVPLVAVRAGRNTRWEELQPDVGYGVTYEVRATWRLDRLVFDGRELQAATQQAARRRERTGLAARIIGLYFAYRRAVAGGRTLQAEEALVELDALTGGYFSLALAP